MNLRQPGIPDNSKITALYERLSVDDDLQGPSNSILNQRQILEDYAHRNGFKNTLHFTDDGVSGTTFDRPGLNEMLSQIGAGKVGTVIIKDMSRAGRDYLQVGLFMERLREKGVRLIALGDGVDSINGYDDFIPFRNIINEWAARDSSRKVTAVMRAKGMEGKRLTTVPIYGYTYDPDDKKAWALDPDAAPVVRRIFQMTIEGNGPHEIAKRLTQEQVERPSYHMVSSGIISHLSGYDEDTPFLWNGTTIATIIAKPEYMGHTVNFRFYKESYKDKNPKKNPQENWTIFEDTHPAIVDRETWETAQRCRKTMKRTDSLGEANPLTGKMFCADCGARMYNHRNPHERPHYRNPNTGKMYMRCPTDVYACSTHNNAKRKFEKACSLHNIRTAVVRELVLETIKAASGFVKSNEAEFIRQVRETSAIQQDEAAKSHRKRIAKGQKRIAELNTLIRKIYEDNVNGKLTDKRFELLSADYENEQAALELSIEQLQAELDSFNADTTRADKFIEIVQRYTDFTELTTPMINEFVDKILVFEADKSSGEREQQVDIYLNFIGKFELPAPELSPEEIAEEERKRALRAKRREYEARYRAKKRQRREQKSA